MDANTESRSTIPKSARKCLAECAAVDASNKYPGGGLISSADDYARFLIELGSGRLIGPQSLAQMWTRQKLSDGTVMHWFPELRAGTVILCNAEGPDLDALQERILAILIK